MMSQLTLNGKEIDFRDGANLLEVCVDAEVYVPHLCWNREYPAFGSCRVCSVLVDGRLVAACTTRAEAGMRVETESVELEALRSELLKMLFVEGNHICPGCEKSGSCQLQAVAYYHGVLAPNLTHFYPEREVDASHPDVLLDYNRCIQCGLCVRASDITDKKRVFSLGGRGLQTRLMVNSASGKLCDTDLSATDRAVSVCPVGALLIKHRGYKTPIGERLYDRGPVNIVGDVTDGERDS